MIRILFLLSAFCFLLPSSLMAQNDPYAAQWKKINELAAKRGMARTALAETKKLYARAKAEKRPAEVVRALVYITGLQEDLREDNHLLSIREIEKEVSASTGAARSLLLVLLGNTYKDLYEQQRYELYGRTETTNPKAGDPMTWSTADFHRKITALYLEALQPRQLLVQTRIEEYSAVVDKGNARVLRPTLYDLLAHHVLAYFESGEASLNRPAYAFELTDPEAFAPAAEFARAGFPTRDTLSLEHKALLLYQDLIRLHLTDAKPEALIDVDVQRLEFVNRQYVGDRKDELYLGALKSIVDRYPAAGTTHRAAFLLASWYAERGQRYREGQDSSVRGDLLIARQWAERAAKDTAIKTESWAAAANLVRSLDMHELQWTLEKVNLPGVPFRASVGYRNLSQVHYRILKASEALKDLLDHDESNARWPMLAKTIALKSGSFTLPGSEDLQYHRTEVPLEGLPVGEYILLASETNSFNPRKDQMTAGLFYVSTISYVNRNDDFYVLHRETGRPIVGAAVQLWSRIYNSDERRYEYRKGAAYKTDLDGYFERKPSERSRYESHRMEITTADDRLFLDDEQYFGYYNQPRKDDRSEEKILEDNMRIHFFTDRSLYRPGQTVYFKGIITTKGRDGKNVVRSNRKAEVQLRNANGETVEKKTVTSNEFGSFNGSFTLPQSGLTGTFFLSTSDNKGSANFNVEEYKRPKFYVQLDTVKGSYRVNDTVVVSGQAIAYAGNNINDATITYRVERTPRFIYDWFWRGFPQRYSSMAITHGEAKTDADGRFTIRFAAIPDRSIDPKTLPVFDYTVSVDVTDLNGETRSSSSLVSVSYTDVVLEARVPEKEAADSFRAIHIRTENMNGVFQSKPVKITVHSLKPEGRMIRERLWDKPDQFVLGKEAFVRLFPYDEYKDESDYRNWNRGNVLFQQTVSTNEEGRVALSQTLPAGFYVIELTTTDAGGREIKEQKYLELYDPKADRPANPQYLWVKSEERSLQPGQKALIEIRSSTDAHVITLLDRKALHAKLNPIGTVQLDGDYQETRGKINLDGKSYWNFDITEEDRGGFGAGFFFVRNNRVYQFSQTITVPWSNKDLQVRFGTFRDKTLPGAKETWTVTISGSKGEKLAAELLASGYDASLDQFLPHQWNRPYLWTSYYETIRWESGSFGTLVAINNPAYRGIDWKSAKVEYPRLALSLHAQVTKGLTRMAFNALSVRNEVAMGNAERRVVSKAAPAAAMADSAAPAANGAFALQQESMSDRDGVDDQLSSGKPQTITTTVQPRRNFNETAFFLPDLRTDGAGNISFSFTLPEALTKWKIQAFAHTKDLAMGSAQAEIITQKELMVQPNIPRFLRQGDHLELAIKVANLSGRELTGQMQLELFDAATNQSVDGWFLNTFPNQYFTVAAGKSEVVNFPVQVPYQFASALTWRVTARAGDFSDAEENMLPVLSNKQLVVETLPLTVKGGGTRTFSLDKLKNVKSETLQHQSLTVEYSSNPAWQAVLALPYLMEYPYECSEQIFGRYYANALASQIANSIPKIRAVLEKWKTTDTAALLSNLQKNSELKTVLLEETPWVFAARSENEQRKNIALLFDLVRLANEQKAFLEKLKQLQRPDGSFPWFPGGADNRYITQYIVTGFGRLQKLGVDVSGASPLITEAIKYLDEQLVNDHKQIQKSKTDKAKQQPGDLQVHYLYMRSFFAGVDAKEATRAAQAYFRTQAKTFWLKRSKYEQGLIALALHRGGDKAGANTILRSLRETSILHEELGRYWKDNAYGRGWYWYQAPIETHALMIEAFSEIGSDRTTVDELRTWLLRNKQTSNWRTTRATADACYALLKTGSDWLSAQPVVTIDLGGQRFNSTATAEAGTGYFKQTIPGDRVQPEMGAIQVSVQPANGAAPATTWGAVYWQYFEDMDKITGANTPLQLKKQLFIRKDGDRGPVLTPVIEGSALKVGDQLVVRIELKADRAMEYVHLKDTRASGLEPVNVLSGYRWQGGLGYYESTRDASTNFFIDYLPKGSFVFEYPLFVTHTGTFTNGIASIQCMYAPEFSAHSEGGKITVE